MAGESFEVSDASSFVKLGLAGLIVGLFLVLFHHFSGCCGASPIQAAAGAAGGLPASSVVPSGMPYGNPSNGTSGGLLTRA